MKRTLTIVLVTFFVSIAILYVYIFSFPSFKCSNELSAEKISPNKLFIVAVSENNCGATTDYATWVTIRKSSERFDPEHQRAVLVIAGKNDENNVELKWFEEYSLLIRFANSKVFHQDKMFENTLINYEEN
jgi:Family of unknown function (DUF5412)